MTHSLPNPQLAASPLKGYLHTGSISEDLMQRCRDGCCQHQFHCCLPFFPLPSDSDRKLLLLHQRHLTWHPRPTRSSLIWWLFLVSTSFTWFLLFKDDEALFWCFQLLIVFNYVPFTVFVNAYPKPSDSLFCNYNLKSSFPAVFKVVQIPSAFCVTFFFVTYTEGVESSKLAQRVKLTFYQMWKPKFDLGYIWQKKGTSTCPQIPHVCCDVCWHTSVHMCTPPTQIRNVIKLRRLSLWDTDTS